MVEAVLLQRKDVTVKTEEQIHTVHIYSGPCIMRAQVVRPTGLQINSLVVEVPPSKAGGLLLNSLSGYDAGCSGCSIYVLAGQHEPSCLKFPPELLDKLQ